MKINNYLAVSYGGGLLIGLFGAGIFSFLSADPIKGILVGTCLGCLFIGSYGIVRNPND